MLPLCCSIVDRWLTIGNCTLTPWMSNTDRTKPLLHVCALNVTPNDISPGKSWYRHSCARPKRITHLWWVVCSANVFSPRKPYIRQIQPLHFKRKDALHTVQRMISLSHAGIRPFIFNVSPSCRTAWIASSATSTCVPTQHEMTPKATPYGVSTIDRQ